MASSPFLESTKSSANSVSVEYSHSSTSSILLTCPRLRLCCLHVLRRPCLHCFRRGSSRLGPAVVEPPLLASLRPPWITVSIDRILLHDQPPPRENRARAPPSQVAPGPSIDPVPAALIQHATDAAPPAPPLLGALPPEAPWRVSTPAALPEMPSPTEIEFIESVERFSHNDWAREQRAKPVCDAAIRYLLLGSPSVLPDDFLLHLAPHKHPSFRKCAL